MKPPPQILKTFVRMRPKEKALVIVLSALFVFSLGRFLLVQLSLPEAKDKAHTITEGFVGKITSLHPLYADFNETDRDISQLIFSGLVRYDPLTKNFLPDLAAKWDRSPNGLKYTFTLVTNAFWHDGTPVTTDDIMFTFRDVIKSPSFRNPIIKSSFEDVTLEKEGADRVVFTLQKPNSYFISSLTTPLIPSHLLRDTPIGTMDKSSFALKPVGTGPYMLKSAHLDVEGDYLDLEAFSQYHGRKPINESIRLYTFPSDEALLRHQGALHAISKVRSESPLIESLDSRFETHYYTLNQFSAVYFNTEHPALAKKEVRQALARSLDKHLLIDRGERRVDAIDLLDRAQEKEFQTNGAEASKMLDSAGYTVKGGDSVIRRDNKDIPLELTLLMHEKMPREIAEEMKRQWLAIGVDIRIVVVTNSDFFSYVTERQYDLLFTRQNLGYNRDVYPLFHSSQTGGPGIAKPGLNFSNFKSFRTDGLTEAIRKEKDPVDKEKLLKQLSSVLIDEMPLVFLSTPVYAYVLDKSLSGFTVSSLDYHSDRMNLLPYFPFTSLKPNEL